MIEPRQIRAARALLNWSQDDLASASGIARSSIKNIENDITTARKDTICDIQTAFEAAGIEFIPGSGVRLKNDVIEVVEGDGATPFLQDSIYSTCKLSPNSEVLIIGMDEEYFSKFDSKEMVQAHIERLKNAGIRKRILIRENDTSYLNDPNSYRWIAPEYFEKDAPIYIYGNKVAIQAGNVLRKTIVIHNRQLADHLKKVFSFVWDKSKVPSKK